MKTFLIMWVGQLVSLMGTAMTRFAVLIWAYQQTGDATTLALLGFFSFGSFVVCSPIAGVWVDRWDKRRILIFSDLGSGVMTLTMLALYSTGSLHIWHLYVAQILTGLFDSFQFPAYTVATSVLVDKKDYTRTSGLRSLALNSSKVIAPFLGGFLLNFIDLNGVMLVDVLSFCFAVGVLLFVRIPNPPTSDEGKQARGSVWQQLQFGFRYIFQRPGLRGLLLIFMAIHFLATLTYFAILPAMILARSGGDEMALASVQAAMGIGGVIGGVMLSVWGGTRRKIHLVLGGLAISFFLGDFSFAVGRSLPVWIFAGLSADFFIPFIVGANRAIWQMKVPMDIQGRIFSVQYMMQESMMPIAYLIAGPLADRVLEPAMMPGGSLADTFGWLVGTGPGAGMGLMFIFTWFFGTLVGASGYLFASVRNIDLPDVEEPIPVGLTAELAVGD